MASNELKDEFLYELWEALERAGLQPDPDTIIGHKYVFKCYHGSHHHILAGIVTAIQVSDEGGFEIHITSPEIWGQKIRGIMKTDKGWAVVVYQKKLNRKQLKQMSEEAVENYIAEKFFYGELQLFFDPIPEMPRK